MVSFSSLKLPVLGIGLEVRVVRNQKLDVAYVAVRAWTPHCTIALDKLVRMWHCNITCVGSGVKSTQNIGSETV